MLAHLYLCRGLSTYAIGGITGLDRQRVTRMLRRAGVPLRPRGAGRLRPLRRDDPPGLTVDEVGRMLGVARNTVLAALRVSGGPPAAAALEPEIETLDRIITWQVKTVKWHLAEGRRLRDKPERITGRKTLPMRRRRVRQSTPRRPGSQPAAGRRKEL